MKNTIIGIIIGVCAAITAFHVYFLYSLSKQVSTQGQALTQVVNFLNQATKQEQDKAPTSK